MLLLLPACLSGASLKVDDSEVVGFLLQTEIVPLCLRIMETGSELSKTVATFIVQKILLDELGLTYMCATPERFYAVSSPAWCLPVIPAHTIHPLYPSIPYPPDWLAGCLSN